MSYDTAILIKSDKGLVRTIRFDPSQKETRKPSGNGFTYNREGAIDEADRQIAAWSKSDQFIGRRLFKEEVGRQ